MSGWVPLGYWDTQVAGLGRMVRKQNPNTFVMSSSLPRRKGNSALWPEDFQVPSRLGPEKAMAPHSSTLAWKIPWMEESGRLQSMGSLRVGHD